MIKLKHFISEYSTNILRQISSLPMDKEHAKIFSEFTEKVDKEILELKRIHQSLKDKLEKKDSEAILEWLKYTEKDLDIKPLPAYFMEILDKITPFEYIALVPLIEKKRDLKAVNA